MEQDDTELVELAQKGDRDAFRQLVERYQRRVYSICYGMLKNADDSMDVSQEVFVKVYRYLEKFNFQSSFYTWLYRITVNMCIDHIRKNQRVKKVEYDDGISREDGDEHTLPSTLGLNPDKVYGRKELRAKMLEALDSLGEKHRTILILREVDGLSYEEIADVLNISKGTVMSRLFHARRYFQEAIGEYVGDDLEI
ncbi:sigma-70 family RNA polymerase sigma factor [Microvenator marinus]|uniref:Sigma-70 family RNA polymerase sigma factor n=1 Tax=Microvenator marinus TaxID=2600177 RepID=A0A5B8XQM8_9DELT|nr:sigma-70 family RNA polymerase sigma factor [Microvenator marinus]QED27900.1 sigma-70 family RNA polymerase sigma factor [Microvenator marinus]